MSEQRRARQKREAAETKPQRLAAVARDVLGDVEYVREYGSLEATPGEAPRWQQGCGLCGETLIGATYQEMRKAWLLHIDAEHREAPLPTVVGVNTTGRRWLPTPVERDLNYDEMVAAHQELAYEEPGPEYNFWDDRTWDGSEYSQGDSERDLAKLRERDAKVIEVLADRLEDDPPADGTWWFVDWMRAQAQARREGKW